MPTPAGHWCIPARLRLCLSLRGNLDGFVLDVITPWSSVADSLSRELTFLWANSSTFLTSLMFCTMQSNHPPVRDWCQIMSHSTPQGPHRSGNGPDVFQQMSIVSIHAQMSPIRERRNTGAVDTGAMAHLKGHSKSQIINKCVDLKCFPYIVIGLLLENTGAVDTGATAHLKGHSESQIINECIVLRCFPYIVIRLLLEVIRHIINKCVVLRCFPYVVIGLLFEARFGF